MSETSKGLYVFEDGDTGELATHLKRLFLDGDGSQAKPYSNMQVLNTLITALENGKAVVVDKTATIGTSWTGSAAPYSQTITVLGLLSTDTPIVDLVPSDTFATAESEEEDWAKVYKITTGADSITVYAKEQTTVSLNIKLKVVR